MSQSDREQLRQVVREMVWEVLDGEIFPLLKDFAATRLEVERNPPPSPDKKEPTPTVAESTFTGLKFEEQKGEKLGMYEAAYKGANSPEPWQRCYDILKEAKATIKDSYHPAGFAHKYWIYETPGFNNRIFRQKLEAPK